MVDVTLTTVSSGFNRSVINSNFTAIQTALQGALSKSAASGNSMSIDFDMNGFDIINVGNVVLADGTSTYVASDVEITGGDIDGTVIGGTTPAAGTFTTLTTTGTANFASSIIFEGATADAFETTITVTDPTADRTITVPDASGTLMLTSAIGDTVQADVITTRGDIVKGSSGGEAERLAIGAAGTALCSDGTDPSWDGVVKQGLHAVYLSASAFKPQTTNGCGALSDSESSSNQVMTRYLPFDAASTEYAQASIKLPSSVDSSATISGYIEWMEASGGTARNVHWNIQSQAQGDDDAVDGSWGTAVNAYDTDGSPSGGDRRFVSFTNMTPAGSPADGDTLLIRVYRSGGDAGDTCDVDAHLVGVMILLTVDEAIDS